MNDCFTTFTFLVMAFSDINSDVAFICEPKRIPSGGCKFLAWRGFLSYLASLVASLVLGVVTRIRRTVALEACFQDRVMVGEDIER